MKSNWILKTYLSLPLWGKIALPLAGVFVVMALLKMVKWAFWLAVIGVVVYLVANLMGYSRKQ
ncbi:MAG: hypothetical protein OHK0039_23020 [Bacteroidia bacterium]